MSATDVFKQLLAALGALPIAIFYGVWAHAKGVIDEAMAIVADVRKHYK